MFRITYVVHERCFSQWAIRKILDSNPYPNIYEAIKAATAGRRALLGAVSEVSYYITSEEDDEEEA